MIKVLLTDDHHLFREGLSRILRDAPGIDLVGCATTGEEAIELVEQRKPDVILMDINMPGMVVGSYDGNVYAYSLNK